MTDMATMMAVRQAEFGPPEVMQLVEVPRPRPRPTEVLVEVRGCGVNPVDWKTRAGGGFLRALPMTLGWDISGVVVEIGMGVTRFAVGDEVFGMPRFPGPAGAYAQFVTARARQLARKPASLSHAEAAGLPLAGLTAWQALVDTARVTAGQRVLINGGGGGVGHLAVQIAKARGAYVIATASLGKHAVLGELGPDELIDYTTIDPATAVAELDLVVDTVGSPDPARWLPVLRPGGWLVPVTGGGDDLPAVAAAAGVRGARLLVEPDGAGLAALAGLVDAGRLRVLLDTEFPLAEAAAAHARGETNRTLGKLVLTPPAAS